MASTLLLEGSNLFYTQEDMSKYRSGGYHPVSLGDTFNARYEVRHKLGWGGFSTVWLVKDHNNGTWRAMKILTAEASTTSRELANLQILADLGTEREEPAESFLTSLYDSFVHRGPNGLHLCIILEFLGPTLAAVLRTYQELEDNDKLSPNIVLKLAKQLLQATDYMHESGYAHGDISDNNIAFSSKALATLDEAELFDVIGSPQMFDTKEISDVIPPPEIPSQLIKAACWDNWIDEEFEDVRLIDFGEMFSLDQPPPKLAQPTPLRSPETIFTDLVDYKVDLWRVGCVIFLMVVGYLPFFSMGDQGFLVSQLPNFVEALPAEWADKYVEILQKSSRTFDTALKAEPVTKLQHIFDTQVSSSALKELLPVVEGLLRYRPAQRMSAAAALKLVEAIEYEEVESNYDEEDVMIDEGDDANDDAIEQVH